MMVGLSMPIISLWSPASTFKWHSEMCSNSSTPGKDSSSGLHLSKEIFECMNSNT